MSRNIPPQIATDQYRDNWERIFGGQSQDNHRENTMRETAVLASRLAVETLARDKR